MLKKLKTLLTVVSAIKKLVEWVNKWSTTGVGGITAIWGFGSIFNITPSVPKILIVLAGTMLFIIAVVSLTKK